MFSWEEIGQFDLPAMIDYALTTTGKSRLHYIGHFQGTTIIWVMGSLRPDYNNAPVVYLEFNANPVLQATTPYSNNMEVRNAVCTA